MTMEPRVSSLTSPGPLDQLDSTCLVGYPAYDKLISSGRKILLLVNFYFVKVVEWVDTELEGCRFLLDYEEWCRIYPDL